MEKHLSLRPSHLITLGIILLVIAGCTILVIAIQYRNIMSYPSWTYDSGSYYSVLYSSIVGPFLLMAMIFQGGTAFVGIILLLTGNNARKCRS